MAGWPPAMTDDPMADLRRAGSTSGLHWLLAMTTLPRSGRRAAEAVELFEQYHRDDAAGAVDTALLLSAWGWDRVTARLIAGIAEADLLDDPGLDQLAERLLWPDRARFDHPADWHEGGWFEVDFLTGEVVADPVDDPGPMHSLRPIAPPLRRWAAARLLRRGRATLDAVAGRAATLGSQARSAVQLGVLDAVETLPEPDRRRAVDLGLASGDARVRRRALELVLARDGVAEVVIAAADDDNPAVRRWVEQLLNGGDAEATQPTLFG